MSRLYLHVDKTLSNEALSPTSLRRLLKDFLESHAELSDRAFVRVEFEHLAGREVLEPPLVVLDADRVLDLPVGEFHDLLRMHKTLIVAGCAADGKPGEAGEAGAAHPDGAGAPVAYTVRPGAQRRARPAIQQESPVMQVIEVRNPATLDSLALAEAIEKWRDPQKLATAREACRSLASEFSIERNARETLEILKAAAH